MHIYIIYYHSLISNHHRDNNLPNLLLFKRRTSCLRDWPVPGHFKRNASVQRATWIWLGMSWCGPNKTICSKERGARLNLKRQHCKGYTTGRDMLRLDPLFSAEGAEVIWCGLPSMLKSIGVDSLRIKTTPELRNEAGIIRHNVKSEGKTAEWCSMFTWDILQLVYWSPLRRWG